MVNENDAVHNPDAALQRVVTVPIDRPAQCFTDATAARVDMKRFLLPIAIALVLIVGGERLLDDTQPGPAIEQSRRAPDAIARAFRNQAANVAVAGEGEVQSILADDTRGSQHQRFILRLSSGQTILIAHNIDIAPRLPQLDRGDRVRFNGIYEWNAKGGVVHWTHHDPQGRHAGGWLEYRGQRYD
ncbi:cold-shock DNA-binding domain-containing protein [Salinisphaera shabanensis T35B1]